MAEPAFFRVQREFTRHLRDPHNVPAPASLDTAGLAIYTNAVIANMEGFMGDNYPRVKAVISAEVFSAMVRDYTIRHESKTPLFVELPGEFLHYLEHLRDEPDDPPFLYELAHFDLLENLVSSDEQRLDDVQVNAGGDVMTAVPIVNPTARLVRYAFAVHLIDVDNEPDEAPLTPTFIVAFRNRANRYGFMDLNVATARTVELLLSDELLTGEQALRAVAAELNHPDVETVIAGGQTVFARLVERDVILGTAN